MMLTNVSPTSRRPHFPNRKLRSLRCCGCAAAVFLGCLTAPNSRAGLRLHWSDAALLFCHFCTQAMNMSDIEHFRWQQWLTHVHNQCGANRWKGPSSSCLPANSGSRLHLVKVLPAAGSTVTIRQLAPTAATRSPPHAHANYLDCDPLSLS